MDSHIFWKKCFLLRLEEFPFQKLSRGLVDCTKPLAKSNQTNCFRKSSLVCVVKCHNHVLFENYTKPKFACISEKDASEEDKVGENKNEKTY